MAKKSKIKEEFAKSCHKLRLLGCNFYQIAEECNSDVETVCRAIMQHASDIRRMHERELAVLQTMECDRLDIMFKGVFQKAQNGDLKAVDSCLRIMERRSKMMGLDQPIQLDLHTDESLDVLDNLPLAELKKIKGMMDKAKKKKQSA